MVNTNLYWTQYIWLRDFPLMKSLNPNPVKTDGSSLRIKVLPSGMTGFQRTMGFRTP